MNPLNLARLALLVVLASSAATSFGQTVSLTPAGAVAPGGYSRVVDVVFDGGGSIGAVYLTINFDTTRYIAHPMPVPGRGCQYSLSGIVAWTPPTPYTTPLPAGSICRLGFEARPGAAAGTAPINIYARLTRTNGEQYNGTAIGTSLTVDPAAATEAPVLSPPSRTPLQFDRAVSPGPKTVTLAGGNSSRRVDCRVDNAAFSITRGAVGLVANIEPAHPVTVACLQQRPPADLGTLTCTETELWPNATTRTSTWPLQCS